MRIRLALKLYDILCLSFAFCNCVQNHTRLSYRIHKLCQFQPLAITMENKTGSGPRIGKIKNQNRLQADRNEQIMLLTCRCVDVIVDEWNAYTYNRYSVQCWMLNSIAVSLECNLNTNDRHADIRSQKWTFRIFISIIVFAICFNAVTTNNVSFRFDLARVAKMLKAICT